MGPIPQTLDKPATKEQLILEAVEAISADKGGCSATDLVEYATPKSSPIHDLFTWNQRAAADKWRLQEARLWMSRINVRVTTDDDGKTKSIRALHAIQANDDDNLRKYVTVSVLREFPALAEQVMADAERSLKGWRERYDSYLYAFGSEFQAKFGRVAQEIDSL